MTPAIPTLSLEERHDLLVIAPGFQGGHSDVGAEIADRLGVAFPLRVHALEANAMKHGLEPYHLWPWLAELRKPHGNKGGF